MKAYPANDKATRVADMIAHREADKLIKGQYWEDGKGCAIGCQVHSSDHAQHARVFGIDIRLSHLQDAIFEALPDADAMEWPVKFLKAIPEGADTSGVWPQFAARMLTRCIGYVGGGDEPGRAQCRNAVARVRDLLAAGVVAGPVLDAAGAAAGAARAAAGAAWEAAREAEIRAQAADLLELLAACKTQGGLL
jgi:hypothetical protein